MNDWQPVVDGFPGNVGSEGGVVRLDDEQPGGARITLEETSVVAPWAITCGIYGRMVHTAYFGSEAEARRAFVTNIARAMQMRLLRRGTQLLPRGGRHPRHGCRRRLFRLSQNVERRRLRQATPRRRAKGGGQCRQLALDTRCVPRQSGLEDLRHAAPARDLLESRARRTARRARAANCANTAIATDATLAGNPASAIPGEVTDAAALSNYYGKSWSPMMSSVQEVEAAMKQLPEGSRSIVIGAPPPGQNIGHFYNAVNRSGAVRFFDGQSGGAPPTARFTRFYILQTN